MRWIFIWEYFALRGYLFLHLAHLIVRGIYFGGFFSKHSLNRVCMLNILGCINHRKVLIISSSISNSNTVLFRHCNYLFYSTQSYSLHL